MLLQLKSFFKESLRISRVKLRLCAITCFIYYLSVCSIKNPKNTIKFYIATRSFILDYTKFYNTTTKLNLDNSGVSCIFSFIFSFNVFFSHYKNNFSVYFFNSCFIFFFRFSLFCFPQVLSKSIWVSKSILSLDKLTFLDFEDNK